jgi:trans-aconitate methyltransferase
MQVNKWSEPEVIRAEKLWGLKVPDYSSDMYKFAIKDCKSWLDLGCGFGRFLNFLINSEGPDINYIGYDSSPDMVNRFIERFPRFSSNVYIHDLTKSSINHLQESIICSAVLIHLTNEEQDFVFDSILKASPKKVSFDINNWVVDGKEKIAYRYIKGTEGAFRMNWQSHPEMTSKITNMFISYNITTKNYKLWDNRYKIVYMLERL